MSILTRNASRILNFLLRARELHNINQISRKLRLSVGSVHKILKNLEERDVVRGKELGNAIYYNLNLDNSEAIKLLELILIDEKNGLMAENKTARVYALDLKKYNAKCIILFGSIIDKAEEAKDVDVLYIVRSKKQIKEVNNFCLEISKIRTKKINPLIMLEQDAMNNLKNQNKAMIDIFKNGVVLNGEEVFIKIAKNAYQKQI